MKNIKYLLALFAAVLISINLSAQTAEEIIEKHIEALGGSENIQAVKSLKVIGSAKVMGIEIPYTTYNLAPDKTYFEMSVQGLAIKQAYDGTTAWSINPMSGSSSPEVVEGDEAKGIKDRGIMFGRLTTYKNDGAKIEMIGKDKVDNIDAYKILYTGADGNKVYYFIRIDNPLVIKVQKKVNVNGSEMDSETTFADYRKIGNVTMAYSMNTKVKNSPMGSQNIIIDKIEINPTFDETIFSMPTN